MKRIQINFKLSELLLQDIRDTISTLEDTDVSRFIRQSIVREIKRIKRNNKNKEK
jgi:rRNA-processing protein FCF1